MTHGPDDLIQPFSIEASGLRGRLVRLGPAVDSVLSAHDYPPAVARLLGELLALGGVMSSMLKFDGVFTLQTKGDGPVGMMVVDYTAEGKLRGYAQVDEARLAAEGLAHDAGDAPVPRLLGAGHLAFTVDGGPESDKRYQGIVDIEGATLAEVLQHYFRQSEQLPTGIHLAAEPVAADGASSNGGGATPGWRAGGLLLQRLPEDRPGTRSAAEHEEDWRRALILMSSCTRSELISPRIAPNELLFRLFHEDGVRVYSPRPVATGCRCSQERVEKTLRRIPRAELDDLKIEGEVVVTCEFCNATYRFDDAALERVYAS
jgi:molecular chaperone Hsp33